VDVTGSGLCPEDGGGCAWFGTVSREWDLDVAGWRLWSGDGRL